MKFKIVIALLFIFPLTILGQGSILESEKMTAEQKRVAQIGKAISTLETDYSKSAAKHEKNMSSLNPYSFGLSADKNYLLQRKKDIQAALYSIQENSLKEKLRQIDILRRSIGEKGSYNSSLLGNINKLNDNLKKINNHLAGLQKKEGEKNTDKIKHDIEISSLDNEITNLDALLKESKVEKSKKSKSLDDFLKESGRASYIKKSSSKNLDNLLAAGSNKKKSTSKNLDNLLAGGSNKKKSTSNNLDNLLSSNSNNANKNNLDNILASESDDGDFKIDQKNGLTGVINNRGKILIPYRNWSISEYKMGIAKVRKKGETKSCYWSCTAYKEGFVDVSGEFIDGFEIDFSCIKPYGGERLVIIMTKSGRTSAEIEADERASKRRKELKRKQKEIEKKKCKIEINNWKSSIKSRYR